MSTSGYSKTPLGKKLGIKTGFKVQFVNVPDNYFSLFEDFPTEVDVASQTNLDFIHYFTDSLATLEADIGDLKTQLGQTGMLWISWPKKASGVPTDLNGNQVRTVGLNAGLVDIKVCAVDATWSGLKFVIPLKDRA